METAVSAGAATTGVRGGVGLCSCAVTMATAVSAGAATVGVRGGMGLCSCAVTMATAVSAGAATVGIRGGIGLCSCAVTMATAVSAGAATVGVRGGMGLCSYTASVITLVTVAAAMSESWNTYMVNDHKPAFLKPLLAFWMDAAFLYATVQWYFVEILVLCLRNLTQKKELPWQAFTFTMKSVSHVRYAALSLAEHSLQLATEHAGTKRAFSNIITQY